MAIVFGCSTPISIRPLRDMIDSQVIHYDLEAKPLIICLCTEFCRELSKARTKTARNRTHSSPWGQK